MQTTASALTPSRALLLSLAAVIGFPFSTPGQVFIDGIDRGPLYSINSPATATFVNIASAPTTTGVLNVIAGSKLTATDLLAGRQGTGTLNIIDGSIVSIDNSLSIGVLAGANGTVSASSGGTLQVTSNLYMSGEATTTGTLTLTGLGTTGKVGGNLSVGGLGTAYSYVKNGATLTASGVTVGGGTGSTGTLSADGVGTKISSVGGATNGIFIGGQGNGTGSVTNGAHLDTASYLVVANQAGSSGQFTFGSGSIATVGGHLIVGSGAGSTGTLTIDGAGTQVHTAGGPYLVNIGYQGNGSGTVSNGGLLDTAGGIVLGNQAGASGQLTVSGSGSVAKAASGVTVGLYGTGNAVIQNGGSLLANNSMWVGTQDSGTPSVLTIAGTGSSAQVDNYLSIGMKGTGIINVLNGASLTTTPLAATGSANDIEIAPLTGTGTLNIDGAGSHVDAATQIYIGAGGTGYLNVTNGGKLNVTASDSDSADSITVGSSSTAVGAMKIAGTGSQVNVFGSVTIGDNGKGSLTISDGGLLHAGGFAVVFGAGQGRGAGVVSNGGTLLVDQYLAVGGGDEGNLFSSSLDVTNGGTVQANVAFIGSFLGTHTTTVTNGGTFLASDTLYVGGDTRDYGFGVVDASGRGILNLASAGSVTTLNLDIIRGIVTVGGGNLAASNVTIESQGRLNVSAGAVSTTTIKNDGVFAVSSVASDSKSITGSVQNNHPGAITVALDNHSVLNFQGDVLNHGTIFVAQNSGTGGGQVNFNGAFVNAVDGTFTQDPTSTHFKSLTNAGLFSAGPGDAIQVDLKLINTGTFNLITSSLTALGGIENQGIFNIINGGAIAGLYSGTGDFIFHVKSAADRLTLNSFFSGNLDIVFDDGYVPLGTEAFIFFAQGANITDLSIGGVDLDSRHFEGSGVLSSSGTYTPLGAVPEPSSYALAGMMVLVGAIARRRMLKKWVR